MAGAEHAALQLLAYGIDTQRVRLQWRTPFWEWLNRIADTDSHDKAPDNWEPGMANHGGADAISVESIAEWAHEGQKALAGAVMMLAEAIRWGRQLEAEDDAKTAAEVVVNAVAQFPYRVAEAFADTAQMHQGAIVQRVVAETTAMQTESTISRAAGDRIRSVLRG
ncbi:hypothetical protein [Saccharothrix sp.]|uniref:hypothetical protein n=1 Tax=Saccharothrix sp. TaxID=1873460 RepID=UPI0028118426|nr:hypothetical protein [Saccharothrix sp.]